MSISRKLRQISAQLKSIQNIEPEKGMPWLKDTVKSGKRRPFPLTTKKAYEEDDDEEDMDLPTINQVNSLVPKMVENAQRVYDNWEQDEDGHDEMYGSGGICHDIADAIGEPLSSLNIDWTTVSSDHEVHVWVAFKVKEGVYSLDIRHWVYETGGGYTWRKIPNVVFKPEDVWIDKISSNPHDFETHYGDGW